MLCWREVTSAECFANKFVLTKMVSCNIRAMHEKFRSCRLATPFLIPIAERKLIFPYIISIIFVTTFLLAMVGRVMTPMTTKQVNAIHRIAEELDKFSPPFGVFL